MPFDALRFLRENDILHSTDNGHCTANWVQIQYCPFCGSTNYHLGIHLTGGGVNCWRCGVHPLRETIRELLKCSWRKVNSIIEAYSQIEDTQIPTQHSDTRVHKLKSVSFPLGTTELKDIHKRYLESRRYDPELLEWQWGLKGTGIIGSYKMRVIAPITHNGIIVSYQGRDITGSSRLRYKTCPKALELRSHKECLYGLDKITKNSVVVVEGITSVWRLGIGAVATFGITWTMAQAHLLSNMEKVFLLFDTEEQAQIQAEKLAFLLSNSRVKHIEVVQLEKVNDPADLSDDEAKALMKELLG